MSRPDRVVLAVFAATVIVGGSNFVAVRFSNRELEPLWGAAIRIGAAGLLLLGLAIAARVPLARTSTVEVRPVRDGEPT
jgi:hypothetical protein